MAVKENKYDNSAFFEKYSQMPRSIKGLDGVGEWHTLKTMSPDVRGKRVLDLGLWLWDKLSFMKLQGELGV